MGVKDSNLEVPRATIHKQILDAADANPDASIEALANGVSAASVDLVERVLDEYGDPSNSEETVEKDTSAVEHTMIEDNTIPDPEELTEEQRTVLRAIEARPEATQTEIARRIGVSASTVNRRVNNIDGFEWDRRTRIADELLPDASAEQATKSQNDPRTGEQATMDGGGDSFRSSGLDERVDAGKESNGIEPDETSTTSRVATLEQRVAELESREPWTDGRETASTPFDDPELAAKIVRACVASEEFSENEELRIIEPLIDP